MPTVTRSNTFPTSAQTLWETVCNPHHLPRWWPRVVRVEAVEGSAFTQVLRSDRGRNVRADFLISDLDAEQLRVAWSQQIVGTPFERILQSAETTVCVRDLGEGGGQAAEVSITVSQTPPGMFARSDARKGGVGLAGLFARIGSPLMRRAATTTIEEALAGLQRIHG